MSRTSGWAPVIESKIPRGGWAPPASQHSSSRIHKTLLRVELCCCHRPKGGIHERSAPASDCDPSAGFGRRIRNRFARVWAVPQESSVTTGRAERTGPCRPRGGGGGADPGGGRTKPA